MNNRVYLFWQVYIFTLFTSAVFNACGYKNQPVRNTINFKSLTVAGGDSAERRHCLNLLQLLHDSAWKECQFWKKGKSDEDDETRYMNKNTIISLLQGLDTVQIIHAGDADPGIQPFGDYQLTIDFGPRHLNLFIYGDTIVVDEYRQKELWLCLPGFAARNLFSRAVQPSCDCVVYFDVEDTNMFNDSRAYYFVEPAGIRTFGFTHIVGDSAGHLLLSVTPAGQPWDFTGKQHTALPAGSSRLHVNLRFYDKTREYMLYSRPDQKSRPMHVLDMKDTANHMLHIMNVEIKGCHKKWLKVEFRYKGNFFSGWLQPYDYCPNPFTTCG